MTNLSVNKVILIGNLGCDPEVRYIPRRNSLKRRGIATQPPHTITLFRQILSFLMLLIDLKFHVLPTRTDDALTLTINSAWFLLLRVSRKLGRQPPYFHKVQQHNLTT
nr:single-stranded DNA-binding protein [Photobacterium proteolyticum]